MYKVQGICKSVWTGDFICIWADCAFGLYVRNKCSQCLWLLRFWYGIAQLLDQWDGTQQYLCWRGVPVWHALSSVLSAWVVPNSGVCTAPAFLCSADSHDPSDAAGISAERVQVKICSVYRDCDLYCFGQILLLYLYPVSCDSASGAGDDVYIAGGLFCNGISAGEKFSVEICRDIERAGRSRGIGHRYGCRKGAWGKEH